MVVLCVPSLFRNFRNRVLMSIPSRGCRYRQILVFKSYPSLDGCYWQNLVLMSFPSLNSWSLRALVFESIPWLLFPGSGDAIFIFLPAIYCCIFDVSLWWNGCIPMLFTSLVGISNFLQGDVGFAIGVWYGRGGSDGGVPLSLSGDTIFLGSNTGLAPC